MEENIFTAIGDFFKIFWIILISIFTPISISIYILTVFFTINFFIGFHTDRLVNGIDFKLDKVRKGILLLLLYFVLLFMINISLSLYGEEDLAMSIPKFFTWSACYWYLVNILRNTKQLFPKSNGIKFFYDILTIKVFDWMISKMGIDKKDLNNE